MEIDLAPRTAVTSQPERAHSEPTRRRTLAIVSHPDAAKAPLTEKLLLFAGAIHIAGSMKGRKASRHRARFRRWSRGVAERSGYRVAFGDIGPPGPRQGAATRMAVFKRSIT